MNHQPSELLKYDVADWSASSLGSNICETNQKQANKLKNVSCLLENNEC